MGGNPIASVAEPGLAERAGGGVQTICDRLRAVRDGGGSGLVLRRSMAMIRRDIPQTLIMRAAVQPRINADERGYKGVVILTPFTFQVNARPGPTHFKDRFLSAFI